jgi:hypothetical protein
VPFATTLVERHTTFASLVAYRMAPYGYSTTTTLSGMLAAERLNCSNYAWLTYRLVRKAWGPREAAAIWIAGWDDGIFGNHAQLHVGNITLDPTLAAIARVTFHELAAGVRAERTVWFGGTRESPELVAWQNRVLWAMVAGEYPAGRLLYRNTFE